MTYNCFIIDDEPLAIEVIKNHIGKVANIKIVGEYTDGIKAFLALKEKQVDLIFLDIEMPEFTGLDFIRSMQSKPEIIITTAYREFAVQGYELNILDYLVKPIPIDRFLTAIDKFFTKKSQVFPTPFQRNFIMIRANRKDVRVNLNDILYIEGLKDYVKIFLANEAILTKASIGNFYKLLNPDMFFRIHKSYVVAIDKITAITPHDVEIGRLEIPIGRTYKEEFHRLHFNKT